MMKSHFSLTIEWEDEEGNSPCVKDREILKLYALERIAEEIGRGELSGVGRGDINGPGGGDIDGVKSIIFVCEERMEKRIVREEGESYYYGSWSLEEDWQLTQKPKKLIED